MIAFCIALIFSLLASVGIAQDLNLNTDTDQMNSERNQVENEKNCRLNGVERTGLEDTNPDLPYLLRQGQQACLDNCQRTFATCMSSAKSADSTYRCEDNRWRCTRNCDNEWYPKLQL